MEIVIISGNPRVDSVVSCEYVLKLKHNDIALDDSRNVQIKKLCIRFLAKTKQKRPLFFREKVFGAIVFHIGIKRYVLRCIFEISIFKNRKNLQKE